MAKKKQYWAKRSEQKLTRVLADAEKTLNLLESQYKNASISINKDIKKLYSQFAGENNISMDKAMELIHGSEYLEWRMSMDEYLEKIDMTGDQKLLLELNALAMRSRITRLEALDAEIKANVAILTQDVDNSTGELLEQSLKNTYYENMYDEYKDRNPKVYDLMREHNVGLSKAQIDRELKIPWSGANYSTNLWNNADYIAGKCQKLVAQNIIAGTSIDKLTKEITKTFGNNYKAAARRLLLTESAYVKGQADKLTYEKLGIKEYEVLATLDSRTSEICQSKDGKHYPIDDAKVGVNYPPFHPHCRTTTVKYNPKTYGRTRIARGPDGKNVTVPYDLKYKDWLEWVKGNQGIQTEFENLEVY
nr:MAG TPA: minor capsid protein [Caudoviricetes sp.]